MLTRDEEIGRKIVGLRIMHDMTQAELSRELQDIGLNWSQVTLSKVESGTRAIRLTEAEVLAKHLDVPVSELLEDSSYIRQLITASEAAHSHAVASIRESEVRAWVSNLKLRLLHAITPTSAKEEFTLHGNDWPEALGMLWGNIYIDSRYEHRALFREIGHPEVGDALFLECRSLVEAWSDDPSLEAGPPLERFGIGYAEGDILHYWRDARDGDEDSLLYYAGLLYDHKLYSEFPRIFPNIKLAETDLGLLWRVEGPSGPSEFPVPPAIQEELKLLRSGKSVITSISEKYL